MASSQGSKTVVPAPEARATAPVSGQSVTPATFRPSSGADQGATGSASGTVGEDVELLTRLVVGLVLLGSDELVSLVRQVGREIQAEPQRIPQGKDLAQASSGDLARFLALGLFARGRRGLGKAARTGAYLSLGTASWVAERVDRLTDNRLVRPVRRPIESRLRNLGYRAGDVIREGHSEEGQARATATGTINDIIDQVIGYLSEDAEIQAQIRRLIAAQGIGLGDVVVDNTRLMSTGADDAVEGIVRRILRLKPRSDLAPSPLAGKPQTMYVRGREESQQNVQQAPTEETGERDG